MSGEVVRSESGQRLVVDLGDGEAELTYRIAGGRMIIRHTGVPPAHRNQGIAGRLVEAAIALAVERHLTVVPLCPYARKWLDEHPAEASLVTIDRR